LEIGGLYRRVPKLTANQQIATVFSDWCKLTIV
jgi:hypothetical protein